MKGEELKKDRQSGMKMGLVLKIGLKGVVDSISGVEIIEVIELNEEGKYLPEHDCGKRREPSHLLHHYTPCHPHAKRVEGASFSRVLLEFSFS